jgi:hypothetical protein
VTFPSAAPYARKISVILSQVKATIALLKLLKHQCKQTRNWDVGEQARLRDNVSRNQGVQFKLARPSTCNHSTAVPDTQTQAAAEGQGRLQTLREQRYSACLYLCDKATQTTRTNISDYNLNPHATIPRSLSVEFKNTVYILYKFDFIYIYICKVFLFV